MRGFAKDRPEIVVLDIVMPEMDGIELIQWLIDQAYDGRLIVVSGFSPDYVKLAQRLAEAKQGMFKVETLTKPIPLATLRNSLED